MLYWWCNRRNRCKRMPPDGKSAPVSGIKMRQNRPCSKLKQQKKNGSKPHGWAANLWGPRKSKTFWGEEERQREWADDFLKRKSRRERYIVRDDFGRGRRDRSCFATPLAVPGEKLPWSVVFLPTAAPLSPRCICHRQRSPITPGTLRVPRVVFLHIQKTASIAFAVLAVLAGAEGIEPSALGFGVAI